MQPLELFMTALPAEVTLDKTPTGTYLRGLPVLRPGTWNGRAYTEADLQALASNFAEIREGDRWTPPLRPRHLLDAEGKPLALDARETLAWHDALTYDATDKLLKADIEIVDAQTVADLEAGKLRYVSAEIWRNGYTSPVTGKRYETPVYYGAAFVDNPAVKGMPWQIVVNAAEYNGDIGHTRPGKKDGETKMSWLETLKSVLRKEGVADDELAEVDQLAAKSPPAAPQAPTPPESPPDDGTKAQVEQLLQTVKEQSQMLEQLRTTRTQEAAQATVDGLVKDGVLPPALRVQCLALVQRLTADETQLELLALDAEGKQATRKARALELLQEILEGLSPKLRAPAAGLWQGSERLDAPPPPLTEAQLDAIAAATGGTPKGAK